MQLSEKNRKLLRVAISRAAARLEKNKQKLIQASPAVAVGDRYLLAPYLDFQWVVVQQHDSGLRLLVPYDQHPLVGSLDVEIVEDDENEPAVLRCGFNMCVPQNILCKERRTGFVPAGYIQQACQILADLANGKASSFLATDDDPEYWDWWTKIAKAAAKLEWFMR